MAREQLPAIAGVFADPDRAGRAAEDQPLAGLVDVQGMAIDQVVGVFLRQAVGQHVECSAAVAGAGDDDFAIDGDAVGIAGRGDEPGV